MYADLDVKPKANSTPPMQHPVVYALIDGSSLAPKSVENNTPHPCKLCKQVVFGRDEHIHDIHDIHDILPSWKHHVLMNSSSLMIGPTPPLKVYTIYHCQWVWKSLESNGTSISYLHVHHVSRPSTINTVSSNCRVCPCWDLSHC